MKFRCFFKHDYIAIKIINYIDKSYGDPAVSHIIQHYCSRCHKIKMDINYNKGFLSEEVQEIILKRWKAIQSQESQKQ